MAGNTCLVIGSLMAFLIIIRLMKVRSLSTFA